MTTTDARPVRTTLRGAPDHITARRPFVAANGSMHGEVVDRMPSRGRLDPEWAKELDRCITAAQEAGGQTFVVFSYATPIAWTTPDGALFVAPERYSVTTCRHQYAARQAVR